MPLWILLCSISADFTNDDVLAMLQRVPRELRSESEGFLPPDLSLSPEIWDIHGPFTNELIVVSKRKLRYCFEDLEQRNVCPRCWIKKRSCICEKVTQTNIRHNILLYMHYRGNTSHSPCAFLRGNAPPLDL